MATSDIDCTQARQLAGDIARGDKGSGEWGVILNSNELKNRGVENALVRNAVIEGELIGPLSGEGVASDIVIENSIIRGAVDFRAQPDSGTQEKEGTGKDRLSRPPNPPNPNISFRGTIFLGEVNFSGVEFLGNADFSNTKFCGRAIFDYAAFFKKANYSKAEFHDDADFFGADFGKRSNVSFSGAKFFKKAKFNLAVFGKGVPSQKKPSKPQDTEAGPCDYTPDTGIHDILFINVHFIGDANFTSAFFNTNALFNLSTFNSTADFKKAKFCLNADFNETVFQKPVYFKQVEFHKELVLRDAKFNEYIDLRFSKITKLNFRNVSIPNFITGVFDLRNSQIGEAHFEDIVFEDDVNFFKTKFGDISFSEWAKNGLNQYNYNKSDQDKENGHEGLELAEKCNVENLIDARPATVFRDINFESDAVFLKTDFCGRTAFEKVNFEKSGNFIDVNFKCKKYSDNNDRKDFSLSYLTFSEFNFRLNRIPPLKNWVHSDSERITTSLDCMNSEKNISGISLQKLSEVFEDFESTFKHNERFEDKIMASRFKKHHQFHESLEEASQNARSLCSSTHVGGPCEFAMKYIAILSSGEFWIYIFWGWNSEYGTNLKRILFTSFMFFFVFTAVFFAGSHIRRKKEGPESESVFRIVEVPLKYFTRRQIDARPYTPKLLKNFFRNLIDSLHYSMILLFKIGKPNLEVADSLSIKTLSWVEWALGYWLIAILVLTLLNTVPIINTIVGALL